MQEKKTVLAISFFCNAMVLMVAMGALMLLAAHQTNYEILHLMFIIAIGACFMVFLNIFLSAVLTKASVESPKLSSHYTHK